MKKKKYEIYYIYIYSYFKMPKLLEKIGEEND